MAKPTTRAEFKQYCLRKLGAPVINIELSDSQIEDRIDQAISFWNDYLYDGSEHVYLKHELTQEDIDRGYIEAPPNLTGVTRIFETFSIMSGSGMFNVTYQFVLHNLQDLTGGNIQNYFMTMQNLRFMQEWLAGLPMIRYNRNVNKIHLDITKSKLTPGKFLIIEAYAPIDETNPDIWNDRWLQNYATVLIKENWGSVLTKYTDGQLIGGMQFNGQAILNDAMQERMALEAEAKGGLQAPIAGFTG